LQQELSNGIRQRQLREIGIDATPAELKLFGEHEAPPAGWTLDHIQRLETLFLRVFDANAKAHVFDHKTLTAQGAARFRGACRELLIARKTAGRYYWRSKIRLYDLAGWKQIAGLAIRSAVPGLRLGHPTGRCTSSDSEHGNPLSLATASRQRDLAERE
jgi:hypothetical protein